jgi:hypothetical protein
LPGLADPHLAPAGYRTIPALADGRRLGENALAVGPPCDAQGITETAPKVSEFALHVRRKVMSDASEFLKKWVRKNVKADTAAMHDDTLTAGRLAEECLWEAQGENLTEADVKEAAGGNLLTFMVSELNGALNRAADREIEDEGEWE